MTKLHDLMDCGMSREEKERTAAAALKKIHAVQKGNTSMNEINAKPRRFSRKTVILAASIILIMAFGVGAYATEFFQIQLGKVGKGERQVTTAALRDSAQFKAREEFQAFLEGEWNKKEKGGYDRIPDKAVKKEEKRLMKKYNLIAEEGEAHDANSVQEAFSKLGIEDFLGDNNQIFNSKNSHYYYLDAGRIGIISATNAGKKEAYYELTCMSNRIADFYGSWQSVYDKSEIVEEWDFTTDEGVPVKSFIAKLAKKEKVLRGIHGEKIYVKTVAPGHYIYESIFFVKDYTITLFVSSTDKDYPFDQSKEKFEQMINQFQLNKLQ